MSTKCLFYCPSASLYCRQSVPKLVKAFPQILLKSEIVMEDDKFPDKKSAFFFSATHFFSGQAVAVTVCSHITTISDQFNKLNVLKITEYSQRIFLLKRQDLN